MKMIASRDARLRTRHEDLADMGRFEELGQFAAIVALHVERIGETVFGQVREIRRIKAASEPIAHIGKPEVRSRIAERLDHGRQGAESRAIRGACARQDDPRPADRRVEFRHQSGNPLVRYAPKKMPLPHVTTY